MRTPLLMAALALALLAVFNPDRDDFRAFIETRSEALLRGETGDTALGRVLSGAGSRLAGAYVEQATRRSNYVVFSLYTIDLDGAEGAAEEWRFLGIAGMFFETQRPAALAPSGS